MAFNTEEIFRKKAHVWDGVPVEKGVKSVPLSELIFLLAGNELKLLLIMDNMKDDDYCLKVSFREIANIAGISTMTAQKALNRLLETSHRNNPLLEKLGGNGKSSNLYRVMNIKM